MNATVPLNRHSTPFDIYTVCTSYQQLCLHNKLKPVANLLQCITSFNNRRHIYNTAVAFAQHRALNLTGQLHKRARVFTTPASTLALSEAPAPDSISHAAVATDITRLLYEQQLTSSMHVSSLAIKDKRIFTQKRWLCDSAMDLCLHSLNKQQGFTGDVVFLSSQRLQQHLDLAPDMFISGRPLADSQTLVKSISLNGNHWMCAVWSRQLPTVIHTLDSMSTGAAYQQALVHFTTLSSSNSQMALAVVCSLSSTAGYCAPREQISAAMPRGCSYNTSTLPSQGRDLASLRARWIYLCMTLSSSARRR